MLQTDRTIESPPDIQLIECEIQKGHDNVLSRDEMINSAIDFRDSYHRDIDDGKTNDIPTYNRSLLPGPSNLNNVAWSDMFDTELLQDDVNLKRDEDKHSDKLFFDMPEESSTCVILQENVPVLPMEVANKETFKEPKNKPPKRKKQMKVTNENIKKLKKLPSQNMSLRKEKYTKTVKNWLSNVDSSCDSKEIAETKPNTDSHTDIKDNNDCKVSVKKKVVQAQLANKGGVMKYGKPKPLAENSTEKENKSAIGNNNEPSKDDIKEKKIKTKFIAPIKSQVPVKDIVYNVITVDECYINDNIDYFNSVDNTEVTVVVVYRNGFCQLNSNYTEECCVPEGILMNINEQYFYMKTFEGKIQDIIQNIFKLNTIICFDGKLILMYLNHFFEVIPASLMDMKIGGALIDPDNLPENFADLQKLISYTAQFTIATDCTLQKVAWYCVLLKECASKLKDLLVEKSLWNIFVEIEMPLVPVIADMEKTGIAVDLEKLKAMEQELVCRMKRVEEQCHAAAGRPFAIHSQPQLRALLYDELRLDARGNRRVRETCVTGAKSTSETALRGLVSLHPLPGLILEYRRLHKAHATSLAGIAHHVRDGVVRPTWVQIAAATGRIACNNPNLQAIPKTPFHVVMPSESGDAAGTAESPPLYFRSVYAARRGRVVLAADFRQVECRIFAVLAADAPLLAALANHADIFIALSAQWLKKEESEVTVEERERTKRVVYASLYGAGARKLADMLDQPYEQALAVLASFNRSFPSLRSFCERTVSQCLAQGGVARSAGGRARALRDVTSPDDGARARARRQALNHVVQGSAADVCKTAMVVTSQRLRAARPALEARLLLQIHDELLWEVAHHDLDAVAGIVGEVMAECGRRCGLAARLPVALAAGPTWGDLRPMPGHH